MEITSAIKECSEKINNLQVGLNREVIPEQKKLFENGIDFYNTCLSALFVCLKSEDMK
jgi:hypothetical protein